MHSVSSKEIQKARRTAKRTRSAVACARCKASKVKCNDYRPCKQCTDSINLCDNVDFQGSKLASSKKTIKREYNEHVSRPLASNLQIRSEKRIENLEDVNHTSFPGLVQAVRPLHFTPLNLCSSVSMLQNNTQILSPLSRFVPEDFSIGRSLAIQTPPNLQFRLPPNLYVSEPTFLPSLIPRPASVAAQMTERLQVSAPSAPLSSIPPDIIGILLATSPPQTVAPLLSHFRF